MVRKVSFAQERMEPHGVHGTCGEPREGAAATGREFDPAAGLPLYGKIWQRYENTWVKHSEQNAAVLDFYFAFVLADGGDVVYNEEGSTWHAQNQSEFYVVVCRARAHGERLPSGG